MKGKRWIGRLLAFCMVIGLMVVMPMPASAEGAPVVRVGSGLAYRQAFWNMYYSQTDPGTVLQVGMYYPVGADGKSLGTPTSTAPSGKGYIQLKESGGTYVLTLKDFRYTSPGNTAIKIDNGDLVVRMEGNSTITAGDDDTVYVETDSDHYTAGCSIALFSTNSLSFEGSGSLTLNGGKVTGKKARSYGIYTEQGDDENPIGVKISEGMVTANGGPAPNKNGGSRGVYAGEVTVTGGALYAYGGETPQVGESYGVLSAYDVKVSNGTLKAYGDENSYRGYGLWSSHGGIYVSGGVVDSRGSTESFIGSTIEVTGGKVIAELTGSMYLAINSRPDRYTFGENANLFVLGRIDSDAEVNGTYLYQKLDRDWAMNGNVSVPTDKTLTIGSGETLVIPAGSNLVNNGKIQNNGTIKVQSGATLSGNTVEGSGKIIYCYNVTFDANGHGIAPAAKIDVESGRTISAPIEPTAEGFLFEGWYKEAAGTNPWDFDTDTVTGDLILYAKWVSHTHTGTLVEAKEATCTEDGNTAYYACTCGKWFSDAACTTEITNHNSVMIWASHSWAPGFTAEHADANYHYPYCTVCDEQASYPIPHQWNCEAATEDSDKHCIVCGYVAEPQLAHTHVPTKVEAKDPTFAAAGNKEYYTCPCGGWFEDADCTIEIADHNSVRLPRLEYAFTGGDGGVYTKGSGSTLEFTANGPKDDCTGIRVDGAVIPESNYTLVSGSTVITLKNDYLETLSVGGHTIDVEYGDRSAQAGFTVATASQGGGTTIDPANPGGGTDKPSSGGGTSGSGTVIQPAKPGSGTVAQNGTPNTGDDNQAALWLGMMLVAGAGIGVLGFRRKKNNSMK